MGVFSEQFMKRTALLFASVSKLHVVIFTVVVCKTDCDAKRRGRLLQPKIKKLKNSLQNPPTQGNNYEIKHEIKNK